MPGHLPRRESWGSSGGGSGCIEVLPRGTGRSRTSCFCGSQLDHRGGMRAVKEEFTGGGKKGIYLTT